MLEEHMKRVAAAGWLRVSVAKACALYHAAAVGVVMTLLASTPEQRDRSLSSAARDQALRGIITKAPVLASSMLPVAANQLRALLESSDEGEQILTDADRSLMAGWLLRITKQSD